MRYLWNYLKSNLLKLVLATALSSLSGLGIIFIMRNFHQGVKNGIDDPLKFFVLVGVGLAGFVVFGLMGEKILFSQTARVVRQMRIDFCRMIFKSDYEEVEDKKEALFSSLVTDINNISRVIEKLPNVNQNLIISIGGVLYLIFISWQLSIIMIAFIVLTYLVILRRNKVGYKLDKASRKSWDNVYHNFHDTIFGIKELNLDSVFKEDFIENELDSSVKIELKKKVRFRFFNHTSNKISASIMIVCISTMFAVCHVYEPLNLSVFAEFLTISLFLINPLASFSSYAKDLVTLNVLSDHIKEIGILLQKEDTDVPEDISTSDQSIYLKNLEYTYKINSGDHKFHLGPVTLEIPAHKVTIIYGSNGSGKTTLSRVIAGLYQRDEGELTYGETRINNKNLQSYRNKVSAVFTDNHLFRSSRIQESDSPRLKELLTLFEIDRHVKIIDNKISSKKLSSGQSKRLALVLSMMADKEIYIFDEWAANQDPQFKEIFYYKLIAQLKKESKTIILITHDDRYFTIGDQLVHLVDGKIKDQSQQVTE